MTWTKVNSITDATESNEEMEMKDGLIELFIVNFKMLSRQLTNIENRAADGPRTSETFILAPANNKHL